MKKVKWVLASIAIASLTASVSYAQGGYECGACHPEGAPIANCLASGCHDTYDNGNHHTTESALNGMCAMCHNPGLVANYDEENPSSFTPGPLTPTVESCNNCHKGQATPLDGIGVPYPHPLYNTEILEHMDLQGHVSWCTLCHALPPPAYPIRQCETCHTVDTLHGITGHIEGGYWYDENGVWTEIIANDRCIACHSIPPDPAPDTMLYVSQDVGTYDTTYSELDEADCRSCHGLSLAARHHVLIATCECNLVPDTIPTVIHRGGTLGFQASVTNNTGGMGMVLFGTKVTKPDESQTGFIWGPLQVWLNPHQTKSGHKTHTVPSGFELGTYTYHGYVGRYGNIYDECQFDFEVVP